MRGARTQKEIAEAAGVTSHYISLLERGERDASTTLMVKLAEELNCSVDDLLTLHVEEAVGE